MSLSSERRAELEIDATAADTYRYLNFDELADYVAQAEKVTITEEA